MDLAWNVVYDLLEQRRVLGGGLEIQECTGIHSWVGDFTPYTVVHAREVAVLFVGTRPVDATMFHHDLLADDGSKSFFTLPGLATSGGLRNLCSGSPRGGSG